MSFSYTLPLILHISKGNNDTILPQKTDEILSKRVSGYKTLF